MIRISQGLLAAALTISLAGCAGQPASPSTDDVERDQLVQQVLDLKGRVTAAGRMTPEHRREVETLAAAFRTWQERTGRSDISVSAPAPDDRIAAAQVVGGGSTTCDPCPPVTVISGRICFLDGSTCTDTIIRRMCWYTCFNVSR